MHKSVLCVRFWHLVITLYNPKVRMLKNYEIKCQNNALKYINVWKTKRSVCGMWKLYAIQISGSIHKVLLDQQHVPLCSVCSICMTRAELRSYNKDQVSTKHEKIYHWAWTGKKKLFWLLIKENKQNKYWSWRPDVGVRQGLMRYCSHV